MLALPNFKMTAKEAAQKLKQQFGDAVSEATEYRGEITLTVSRQQIVPVCKFLKTDADTAFDMLTDVSGVDNYGEDPRFEVVYHLYSMKNRCWLRLKVKIPEDDLTVDSVTGVWRGADWHEREAFDMFGIKFRGHPNLKRILMWDGYPHFPLRKDFPLAGIPAELPGSEVMPENYKNAEVVRAGDGDDTFQTPRAASEGHGHREIRLAGEGEFAWGRGLMAEIV
jgi:NADH-quinone oxidoreductase subunit C